MCWCESQRTQFDQNLMKPCTSALAFGAGSNLHTRLHFVKWNINSRGIMMEITCVIEFLLFHRIISIVLWIKSCHSAKCIRYWKQLHWSKIIYAFFFNNQENNFVFIHNRTNVGHREAIIILFWNILLTPCPKHSMSILLVGHFVWSMWG